MVKTHIQLFHRIIPGIVVTALTMIPFTVHADPTIEPATNFSKDIVSQLWQRIEAGETSLDESSDQAFLRSLLDKLDIPVESQVLVFSKTSLQKSKISPQTPRAIYFNEDCYIGWVQNGDLEVAVSEPGGSMQYYLIHKTKTGENKHKHKHKHALVRSNQCLSCHVRGELQVQSVFTRDTGYPYGSEDRYTITYQSPLRERWGGWYVTGQHGSDLHMGNVTATMTLQGTTEIDRLKGANVKSLKDWFPIEPYLAPTSDIVALMVLEHQYVVHNAFHEAAESVGRQLAKLQDQQQGTKDHTILSEASLHRVARKRAEEIVDLLLFEGEYQLQSEGIQGSPEFQTAFRRNARFSSDCKSLKDFDLKSRLFQHRCSYMIHSASFKSLPDVLRQAVYARLEEVLSGRDSSGAYDDLPVEERNTIRRILLDTEPDARRFWSQPQKH